MPNLHFMWPTFNSVSSSLFLLLYSLSIFWRIYEILVRLNTLINWKYQNILEHVTFKICIKTNEKKNTHPRGVTFFIPLNKMVDPNRITIMYTYTTKNNSRKTSLSQVMLNNCIILLHNLFMNYKSRPKILFIMLYLVN